MPKLVIKLSHEFKAGPIQAIRNHKMKKITSSEIKKLVDSGEKNDFSVCVSLLDPEEGWPTVGFQMLSKSSQKIDSLEWEIDEARGMVLVRAKGELESKALRAGVAPMIEKLGKKADFRLHSFNFKGGKWEGFEAPIVGQGEEDFENWYKITDWSLK